MEFSFERLEPPAPPPAAVEAGALLDVVAQARAEAEAIRAQARSEGLAAGRAEALEDLAPAAAALVEAAQQAAEVGRCTAERLERQAVDLGLAIAEKVVAGALNVQPELVLEAVRGALRGIVERERVIIQVNPADLDLVREAMGGLRGELGGIEQCEVQSERRVGRGGAVVRTADADVDARVETKLARAREVVEAALLDAVG